MSANSVIIIFLDGVGLGVADPAVNPFMRVEMATMQSLLGLPHLSREGAGTVTARAALLGLDARLGVAGLPQSATGQTTILTGRNAPALLGEHYGPYPNQPLRQLLAEENLFKAVLTMGRPVAYANAYPERFLDRFRRGKGRLSANTLAAVLSGLKLRGSAELRQGRALSAFLTNEHWPETGLNLPRLSPYQAGRQLLGLAQDHALTFFEFWYSDLVGHKQEQAEALELLHRLDQFLAGLLAGLAGRPTLLLVVSDHGNFEDWSTNKHTLNPSLTLLSGADFARLVPNLNSLQDIKPAVLAYLS
jgi:hypothetical protein